MTYEEQIHELLHLASGQNDHYQATSFWNTAIDPVISDLKEHGMENFRSWRSALTYFVPTYGAPGNSLSLEMTEELHALRLRAATTKQQQVLNKFISGENQAFADYRVAVAVLTKTAPWLLERASESTVGNPTEQFIFDNRSYSRSFLNYLLGLAALSEHCDLKSINNVLEIGGGFGTLGEILHGAFDRGTVRYCNLDIPPTCSVAEYYLSEATDSSILGTLNSETVDFNSSAWSLAVKPNWDIENIKGNVDLFVNFISFQEMEPAVVKNYMDHVLALNPKWVLLRHIREGKPKLTEQNPIGVIEPTTPEIYTYLMPGYRNVTKDSTVFGTITADGFHSDVIVYSRTEKDA